MAILIEIFLNPRIDPLSLLDCLSVLLNPLGGIKTQEDVARIVSLMSKFSKKLVSKCVYVEILHATESKLLENYMVHGGWELVSQWILDAVETNNGPLLETLLSLTKKSWFPLEVLKINDCARSVNSLITAAPNERVKLLAHEVVSHWKEIARMNDIKTAAMETTNQTQVEIKEEVEETIIDSNQVLTEEAVKLELSKEEPEDVEEEEEEEDEDACDATSTSIEEDGPIAQPLGELPVYRLTMRDGKHVLAKVTTGPTIQPEFKTVEVEVPLVETSPVKDGPKGAARRKQDLKPKELHTAEDLEKRQQNQEKVAAKKKRADEERIKEKLFKEKQKKLKEKLAEREAKKLKEQKEKDEATLAQLKSTSQKVVLAKIPKKSKAEDGDKKKDSLSEKKADSSRRSSTDDEKKKKPSKKESKSPVVDKVSSPMQPVKHKVKTFNSKFRSTGLEEEPPLPPPRGHSKKDLKDKPNLKRSPPPGGKEPVEKKSKLEDVVKKVNEKPKPKPGIQLLQESNFFMDALNATVKIEPRKRKRRVSSSKDDPPPSKEKKTEKVASPTLTKPVKFYTENQEGKDDDQDRNDDDSNLEARSPTPPAEITGEESTENSELRPDGTKSVLVIHRPADRVKKSVRFKSDEELVSIQYFELDETERVNVNKMGGDMKVSDAAYERDMYMNAKKRDAQPEVIENIPWKLIKIDCSNPLAEPGKNSTEKLVQEEREKTVLQAIYFSPESIPDSPAEALLEEFSPAEPRTIPLDDVTGNLDNVKDWSYLPWIEPKGFAPVATPAVAPPVAGSSGGGGGGWRTGDGQILASSVPEPSTFQPQQGFNVGYETGNMMNPNFGYQSNNFNMPRPDFNNMNGMMNPNMMPPNGVPPPNFMPFPPGNNFNGPPPGNFNGPPPGNWGPQGFRGRGFMRGGRGFFPPRGGLRTNMCKHHMRGFCRNGDSCHFKHQ
ncbi:serine/threonine-protein phosphatase 1 regulatory subunit 10-like isoform X2 [Cloeon dipterum]|uniref:serine/threonine-protein phosphatase 1 regulatory subunit 10-like isoform X2 n=1 Tax=Cloeon dipterum TaxID=197152 RepID=UPI00322001E9